MRPLVQEAVTGHTPESLAQQLHGQPGLMLLRSGHFESEQARYSFLACRPFLRFRSWGSRCELESARGRRVQSGNPWKILDSLISRYHAGSDPDLPFPVGGCFGYWGYELKNFVEPRLPQRAVRDLGLPDCHVGFYDSFVVFDHRLGKVWIVTTGLQEDGVRTEQNAKDHLAFWQQSLHRARGNRNSEVRHTSKDRKEPQLQSNISRDEFITSIEQAQHYIRAGDIYQVNLSHRLCAEWHSGGWEFFERLFSVSPAPFSAFLDCGDFQVVSSSPELFLRVSEPQIQTRPIKGTRPRAADPLRDAQFSYELQTSQKEAAELVMITDLLRNDLGKVCEYGTVQVPELLRLERFSHVQHLVSTVEGRLRPQFSHLAALASCFPGGSITGAPKIRAMEIIDELEPLARGPYTGSLGYIGFNGESQLSIAIRIAICRRNRIYFHVGAGIVADSNPVAEYDETIAKAGGFIEALGWHEKNIPVAERTHCSEKT